MTHEALSALDTENMTEEEARLIGIDILTDEIANERRALGCLAWAIIILAAIAFIIALITKSAEGLIVGFILGILEFCFELNHDERKRCRKYRKKILPAFKSGTYDGSYVAFVRDFRAEAIKKHEELQKYMKKPEDVNRE